MQPSEDMGSGEPVSCSSGRLGDTLLQGSSLQRHRGKVAPKPQKPSQDPEKKHRPFIDGVGGCAKGSGGTIRETAAEASEASAPAPWPVSSYGKGIVEQEPEVFIFSHISSARPSCQL